MTTMTTTKNKPSSLNAKPSKEQLDDFMSKYVSKFLVKEPKTDSELPEMEEKIKRLMEELKENPTEAANKINELISRQTQRINI